MIERIDISLLERYLEGEVEQLLDENGVALTEQEVAQAIEEYQDLVIQLEGAALKAQLQERHAVKTEKKGKITRLYWLAAAAAVLLSITFAYLWKQKSAPQFEDYFTHFKQLETNRGTTSSDFATALESYSRRSYEEAYTLLSALDKPPKEAFFFQGVSALATERTQQAIDAFLKAGIDPTNRYYQQTRWYLALAYWKAGDLDKAKRYWSSIPEDDHNYELAQELLMSL